MLGDLRDFVTKTTGWTEEQKNDDGRYGGLLDLEPGLIYPVAPNGSSIQMTMDITLNGGHKFTIPTEELLAPLRGLNTNGVPVINNSFSEIAVYWESGIGLAPVLGRAFLSQASRYIPCSPNTPGNNSCHSCSFTSSLTTIKLCSSWER
jgi:hypothetical protein